MKLTSSASSMLDLFVCFLPLELYPFFCIKHAESGTVSATVMDTRSSLSEQMHSLMMLQHIASKGNTNREAMSDLVAVASFILKQEHVPLALEKLHSQKAVALAAYNFTETGDAYTDDMSTQGLQLAAAKLKEDYELLEKQFEEGNTALFAGWNNRRRSALGLLGEICLGVESNQALLRLSGGCDLLVAIVNSTGMSWR